MSPLDRFVSTKSSVPKAREAQEYVVAAIHPLMSGEP